MKGDFSRLTFAERKHYRRVLMQQGRVELDADRNEQIAIDDHIADTTSRDIIGASGYPLGLLADGTPAGGFAIALNPGGTDLTISKGRMYVEGRLIENDAGDASLLHQPDLPGVTLADLAPQEAGFFVVYVDVWERLITALDDPSIREVALGGPDTAVRAKLVWQVRLGALGGGEAARSKVPTCASTGDSWRPAASGGTLAAGVAALSVDPLPCILPPETGYRRLENQLYRVEIHRPGGYGEATFKWSRENGSVVAGVVAAPGSSAATVSGPSFAVTGLGADGSLGFKAGDWVELTDDRAELADGAGELLQVLSTGPADSITTSSAAAKPVDLALHPKLRRWDQAGDPAQKGEVPIPNGDWIALEGGVQVQFSGGPFTVGDHWVIPARTRTNLQQGGVEWPTGAAGPLPQPPRGIHHHYAKLGLVELKSGTLQWPKGKPLPDCRLGFPALTELEPVEAQASPCTIVAVPGPGWEKPIHDYFAQTKQPADAEICFPVGHFPATKPLVIKTSGNVKVTGAGWGTKLVAKGVESVLRFEGCQSVIVRDLYAETSRVTDVRTGGKRDHLNGTVTFANCAEVLVENVFLRCGSSPTLRGATCLTASSDQTKENATTGAGTVRVRGSRLWVGEMQIGVLVVHLARAVVEDNEILVDPKAPATTLAQRVKDLRYRAAAAGLLVSQVRPDPQRHARVAAVGDTAHQVAEEAPAGAAPEHTGPTGVAVPIGQAVATGAQPDSPPDSPAQAPDTAARVPAAPPAKLAQASAALRRRWIGTSRGVAPANTIVALDVGGQHITFDSAPDLQSTWQAHVDRNPPGELATHRDASIYVKREAVRILTLASAREGSSGFSDFVRRLHQAHTPVAARGIVVGGRAMADLHIRGNRIAGVLQGIVAGVSHRVDVEAAEPRQVDQMQTVRIRENTIEVQLNETAAAHGRCGIFVGNVDSLEIDDNRITLVPATKDLPPPPADGIRVWGYLGRKAVVRDNHLTRFPLGIRVVALTQQSSEAAGKTPHYQDSISHGNLWLVADNVVEAADQQLAPPFIVAPGCLLVDNRS